MADFCPAPVAGFYNAVDNGYRNISKDMKDHGETCGKNRVYRIMRAANIRSQRGYKRHKGFKGGNVSMVAPNTLDRQFEVIYRIGWLT